MERLRQQIYSKYPSFFINLTSVHGNRGAVVHFLRMAAAKETTLKELGEMLTLVVDRMATKQDVRAIVAEELAPIHAELKSIRRDLDDLREKVENVVGFRKEIDHALERIRAIEKHLGLDKKIAA
jgi:hypothetical protein